MITVFTLALPLSLSQDLGSIIFLINIKIIIYIVYISAYKYASASLSFAIYTDFYRGISTCYSLASRGAEIAVTRSRVDDEKEVRRRQAPLVSNYRPGFS